MCLFFVNMREGNNANPLTEVRVKGRRRKNHEVRGGARSSSDPCDPQLAEEEVASLTWVHHHAKGL